MTNGTCQKWFVKFCAGGFLLDNDAPWSGRPVLVVNDQFETLIENNEVIGESEKCVFFFF